ncbi:ABC transporter ATP-binding protein [candidate division KSB1 bacterium]|nr:ABC transporter ATP-binding protein [candidate division KSB1 bacterium]
MQPVLEIKDLATYFYVDRKPKIELRAVDGISYHLNQGEIMGLVGESGCGKSVSALSLLRLIQKPGKIVRGTVCLNGTNLLGLSAKKMTNIRGKDISMIFQDPMSSLNPTIRSGIQVMEAMTWHNYLGFVASEQRAYDLMASVGIPDPQQRFSHYPFQFSGGMRQRIMIAMALACRPKVLIADEPTTALDVTVQMQVLDLLRQLNADYQTSILLITHDFGVVTEICNKVAVMYAGRIVEKGSIQQFWNNPAHPYGKSLLSSTPRLGERAKALHAIPGAPPSLRHLPSGCAFHPRCQFAMEMCKQEYPPFFEIESDHFCACWLHENC